MIIGASSSGISTECTCGNKVNLIECSYNISTVGYFINYFCHHCGNLICTFVADSKDGTDYGYFEFHHIPKKQ